MPIPQKAPIVRSAAAFAPADHTAEQVTAARNGTIVDRLFARWRNGHASFYDLLNDDGTVTIMGQSPHSGSWSKAVFLRDRARPFQARFATSIVPIDWQIWSVGDTVIVRWRSAATACDGTPYTNDYAYFITMRDGRASALTMFLDMAAFDDVWRRCPGESR